MLVVVVTDYHWMASAAFVIKDRKYIDVYLKLILVQMDIIGWNLVMKSVEMVVVKHLIIVRVALRQFMFCRFGGSKNNRFEKPKQRS